MSMYGANPEQLAQLGRQMQQQSEAIRAVTASITSTLGGTTWVGPARDRFEGDWNGSFRTALDRLREALDLAGRDCIARSSELQRVMGR
jgi:uncharacterized protein YukE